LCRKFHTKSDEGIFVSCSPISKRIIFATSIPRFIHVVFDKTNNGLASTSSFDEFQLSKYMYFKKEGAKDECNHWNAPINLEQCPNQDGQRQPNDLAIDLRISQNACDRPHVDNINSGSYSSDQA